MVAVTYGVSRVRGGKSRAKTARKAAAVNASVQKSLFARFVDAMVESRMRQAHREIVRHAHLLPYSLDERGNRLISVGGKDMPFGGW
jgi:hypothetical protein